MPPEESSLVAEDTGTSESFDTSASIDEQDGGSTETSEYVDDGQPSDEESFSSIDPKTLPPELLAQYKGLQRDYTRKQQAAAERVRQYERDLETHRAELQKYQTWAQQVQPILQQYQQAQQKTPVPEQAPDYSTMTPDEILHYAARKEAEELLSPIQQVVQRLEADVQEQKQARVVDQITKAYTVQVSEAFSKYGEDNVRKSADEITKLIQQIPQLTVQQAYVLLHENTMRNEGAQAVQDSLEAKRRASGVERPNSRVAPVPKLQSTGDAFEDAARAARAELARL